MLNMPDQANDQDVAVIEVRTIDIGSTLLHMRSSLDQQDTHDGFLWQLHGCDDFFLQDNLS